MESFLTIEHSDGWGVYIQRARRLNESEKKEFTEEYVKLMFTALEKGIKLSELKFSDMPDRRADGMFRGSCNCVWIISEKEREYYIKLNKEKLNAKRDAKIKALQAEIAEIEASGPLLTEKEAEKRERKWNNFYNEGGEGYVPHYYSVEELQARKRELSRLLNEGKEDK